MSKVNTTDYFNSSPNEANSSAPEKSKFSNAANGGRAVAARRPVVRGSLAVVVPSSRPQEETDPFRKLVAEWLEACQANGCRPKTLSDYSDKIHKFWWWWHDYSRNSETLGPGPEYVTVREARQFVAYLRQPVAFRWGITHPQNNKDSRQLSAATIAAYGRVVKAFFNWLAGDDQRYIEHSPFTKGVKFSTKSQEDKVIKSLEKDALEKIFQYLMSGGRADTFCGKRDLAMVSLLLDSGIRRGELLGMKDTEKDLDVIRGRARVSGKTGQRWAMFDQVCKTTLRSYLTARTQNNPQGYEALWLTNDGEPLSYYGFGGIVRRIEAGTGVKFHAHQFRHTFGTLMAAQSISLKELSALMGHESVTTTEIYIQLSPDTLANAHRSRSPLAQLDAAKGLRRRPGRPKRIE